jgi:hypothetical protein
MLAAGVDLAVVSKTLDHSSAAFAADVYADVLDELRHAAARKQDAYLRQEA